MSDPREPDDLEVRDPGAEPLASGAYVSDLQMQQEAEAADRLTAPRPDQNYGGGQPGYSGGGPAQPQPQQAIPIAGPSTQSYAIPERLPTREPPPSSRKERSYQAKPDYELVGEPLTFSAFAPPPPPEPGLLAQAGSIIAHGLSSGTSQVGQTGQVIAGQKPTGAAPTQDYEAPMEPADFGSPGLLAKKALFSLAQGYPSLVTGIAGSVAGAAAGGVPGGIIGGALGAGGGAAFQALGPAYKSELDALGSNPTPEQTDKAWNNAVIKTGEAFGIGAASMALFGVGKPFGNAVKSIFTRGALSGATAGLPARIATQGAGQVALSVGGTAIGNVAQGKPASEGLGSAAMGGAFNVVPDAIIGVGGRILGGRPRPGDVVNPTATGLPSDVEAALGRLGPPGTQGALDLTGGSAAQPRLNLTGGADTRPVTESPVTGGRAEGPGEVRVATGGMGPSRPGELVGPGDLTNQRALDLTGGRGPDQGDLFNRQTPQPPTPPVPRGTYPEGPVVQPPVPGLNRVNIGDTNVAAAAPIQQGAADILRRTGVRNTPGDTLFAGYEGGGTPPTGLMAVRDPIGRVGPEPIEPTYRGTVQQPGQGELGLPPGSYRPVGPTKYGAPTPAVVSPRPKWSDFSVEKDHLDPSKWVAKNANGDVAGKGASQQAARADAVARRGKVYAPEPGETAAMKAGEAEPAPITTVVKEAEAAAETEPAPAKTRREINAENLARGRATAKANREAKAAEKAKAAGTTVSVPFMITQGMRRQLADLGYTTEQVREMKPARANEIIAAGEKAEAGTGPVKPAAEKAAAPDEQASSRAGETVTEPVAESVRKKAPAETVTETREAGAEKAPEGEAVTKSDTEKSAPAKSEDLDAAVERAQAAYDEAENEYRNHRITKAELTDAERTLNAAKKAAERTKSGAFSMGEGDVVVPLTDAERQRQSSGMAKEAGAAIRGELAKQTRDLQPQPVPWQPTEGASKIRQGMEIITALLKGDINLTEAIGHYGVKLPGTQGRPRTHASLTEVAREALRAARDPSVEVNLRRNLAAMEKAGRAITPRYKEMNAQLDLLEQARTNRAALEGLVNELEARDRGLPPSLESAIPNIINEAKGRAERDRLQHAASLPEVNGPLQKRLESGATHKLHDLLNEILGTHAIRQLAPQFHELATILRRILPNLDVVANNHLVGERGGPVYGQYNSVRGAIEINPAALRNRPSGGAVMTLLHEGLHGATSDYVDHIFRATDLTPNQLAHKQALQTILGEINRILQDDHSLTTMDKYQLDYATREYIGAPHELITQIFSRPEVTAILAKTKASAELKASMNRFGFGGKLQSVWDGFKNVLRDIFKIRSPDSVLDLVLRPLSEITETAAKFREGTVVARREAVMASDHALGSLESRDDWSRRALQVATSAADKGNVGWRATLRGAMQGGTLHAIHDFIKPYAPSVTGHREALQAVTRASEEERVRQVVTHNARGQPVAEANIDKAMRLRRELTEGPDAPQLNKLATDVTLAGMSVIDPQRNAHLVTQAELNQQQAFQRTFDSLDPRAQQTYRELNEYHNEIYRAEREAQVKNYVELAFPNLTVAEQDMIRQQMRTRQGIEDVIARPDATPVARMMGKRWADSQDLVRLIAKSQQAGFVDGDFFPARRHGEYIVSAGQHDQPGYIVQMFETASEARNFRADLILKRKDVSQVFVKSDTTPRDLVGQAALSTLDRAMERAGLSDVAQEALRDTFVGQMIQQGTRAATRTMRREGILGASVDQGRNVLSDFLAYTTRIGHLTHGAEAIRTLYDVEKEVRALHQAGGGTETQVAIAQAGARELRRRMLPADGDTSADLSGRGVRTLSTLTVLNTLLRPAHYFMQLAGNHTAAASLLAARHGLGGVGALNRAVAQLSGVASGAAMRGGMAALRRDLNASHWDLADLYRRRLKLGGDMDKAHVDLLIDRMNQASLINHTWIREIQRLAGPQGFGDHRFNFAARFLDAAGAGEHALDSMMRVATAKAGFVSELRKNGGNLQGALDYAMQMARDSQPDYSRHNKSRLATRQGSLKWIAPLVTQFKQFGFHMYGVQGNLLATAIRGATGQEKREAIKAIAYLQASHALLWGGVAGSIFGSLPAMVGFGLYDLLSGDQRPHTNQELETQSRNWVKDFTGSKTAADIFAHGVPMAFGADVHRSLQFTNLVGVPELKSYDKPGALNLLGQVMTGASGDTVAGLLDSMSKVLRGDTRMETIAKMMPRVIRDPMEAYVWGTEGLRTGRGQTIVPAKEFSYGDLALKTAGFIPAATSVPRDARAAESLAMQTEKDHKDTILDRFVQAKPADRSKVLAEIYRYNARVPPDERISSQSIKSRLTEQARINAQPGLYGMRVPKTDIRPALERTRFASP